MNPFFNTLTAKTRCITSFFLGVLLVFAFAPYFIFPFTLISFIGLYLLLQLCESKKQAFWLAWCFGFGFFLVGVYWVAYSLLVDAAMFWWLVPFAVCLIPAGSAVFVGVVGWFSYKNFARFTPVAHVFMFSVVWVLMEQLRGFVTQFPWNYLGYAWLSPGDSLVAQFGSVVGVGGLSLLLVLFATLPAILVERKDGNFVRVDRMKELSIVLSPYFWMVVIGAYGYQDPIDVRDDAPVVRVVQPNIAQKLKHDSSKQFEILMEHLNLTAVKPEGADPDLVVWPEAPVNYMIESDEKMREYIATSMPPNSYLITGGMRVERNEWKRSVWNSLFALNKSGDVLAHYDKHILVPFGEFVPLGEYLPFIQKITQGGIGFDKGVGPQTISLPGLPSFSPLICYEVVFPGRIVDDENRPKFLLNITNDAWFGDTSGPHQHLAMARMRAIEEGLPLIRVANTGISAIIDKKGNVLQSLGLNKKGLFDAVVPLPKGEDNVTFYQMFRWQGLYLLMFVMAFYSWYLGRVETRDERGRE